MEESFLHKVYNLVHSIIHPNELKSLAQNKRNSSASKRCPVTGLDISMQPKNSKFLSYTGVKWYYEHDFDTFENVLASRIQHKWLEKDIELQCREIARHIRNSDSNPRNNARRAIMRVVNEKNSLFNNMELIDKKKLRKAGFVR